MPRERRRATSGPMTVTEHHTWTPVWAMPNVSLAEPVDAPFVSMAPCCDRRLREVADRHPILTQFLSRFHNEFGSRVWPTVLMFRDDAPQSIRTKEALGAFRDTVSISAIASSHSRVLTWRRAAGIQFSDAFDIYPWHLGNDWSENLYAFTPAITGMHRVAKLRAQSAPALGTRILGGSDIDDPLLAELLRRWHDCYGVGNESVEHRRLFRALDMARSASRMPGGADSTFYDGGRAIALWVSAFEILAHDGRANLPRVLALLARAPWERQALQVRDRTVVHGPQRTTILTNTAGEIYNALNGVRNAFLHGNPVTPELLRLPRCQAPVLQFAAPLFRMALAAYLDLQFCDEMPDPRINPDGLSRFISDRMHFVAPQRLVEEAILIADAEPAQDDD